MGSDNVCSVVNLNRIQRRRGQNSQDARATRPTSTGTATRNPIPKSDRSTPHPTHFQTLAQGLAALVCRLFRGHAWIRTYYRGRIYLECCHCGARTAGWEVLT
jgi:hypothetical protein